MPLIVIIIAVPIVKSLAISPFLFMSMLVLKRDRALSALIQPIRAICMLNAGNKPVGSSINQSVDGGVEPEDGAEIITVETAGSRPTDGANLSNQGIVDQVRNDIRPLIPIIKLWINALPSLLPLETLLFNQPHF